MVYICLKWIIRSIPIVSRGAIGRRSTVIDHSRLTEANMTQNAAIKMGLKPKESIDEDLNHDAVEIAIVDGNGSKDEQGRHISPSWQTKLIGNTIPIALRA